MSSRPRRVDGTKLRSLGLSLPIELLKAREAAMSRFRPMLREFGLTEQQWRVIRVLQEYGRLDATELARRSILLGPSLTRILQFLETKNLIRRSMDDEDQRRVHLMLTAKGKRLFNVVAPQSEAIYADMEKSFGRDRMEALYRLLSDFYKTLEAQAISSSREVV